MKRMIITLLIFWVFQKTNAQTSDLTIQITGLKSSFGKCVIYLYKDEKGFPTEPKYALAKTSAIIKNNKAIAVFKGIVASEYAISVIHDENNNGKIDTNFLGIPKEGIGTSNNAKSRLGPPSYTVSRFTVDNNNNIINITVKYL